MPVRAKDEDNIRDFDTVVPAKEVSTSGSCSSLEKLQRVCESGGEAVSMSTVKVIDLARQCVEIKSKNAKLPKRNKVM